MSFHILKELFKRFPMMVSALKSDASKYLYGMPKLEAKFYHGGKKNTPKIVYLRPSDFLALLAKHFTFIFNYVFAFY